MFLPDEVATLNGNQVRIVSVEGHHVTIDQGTQVPETHLKRPFPASNFGIPDFSSDVERLDYRTADNVISALAQMELDWRGHHCNGTQWSSDGWFDTEAVRQKKLFQRTLWYQSGLTSPQAREIIQAFENKTPLDRWIPLGEGGDGLVCGNCTEKFFETNGLTVRPTHPCPNPNGLVTEFTLNIPSGKMVIANDLRHLCRIASNHDINGTYGTHLAILDYANNGLACGFGIGNTCPTVSRHKGNRFTIGHRQGGRSVTGICTDLWAYSIVDYEEALRRAEYYGHDLEETKKSLENETFTVPAGLYKFRHFHNIDRDANKVLFAEFKRVGPAWPFEDGFVTRDKNFTVHITQAVQDQVKAWPTLYHSKGDWVYQCARVIQSSMRGCVPDRDWHPNGHRNDFVMGSGVESLPILEIPHFRFLFHWDIQYSVIATTVSRKSDLFDGDVPLNESYAIAAGRVLESTVSFGMPTRHNTDTEIPDWEADKSGRVKIPNPHYDTYNISDVREQMHKAAQLWYGLIDRYPHVAIESPVFAKWMEDREAVIKWIDEFNLGPEKFDRVAWQVQVDANHKQRQRNLRVKWMQIPGTQVQSIETQALGVVEGLNTDAIVNVLWDGDVKSTPEFLKDLELGPESLSKKEAADKKTIEDILGSLKQP